MQAAGWGAAPVATLYGALGLAGIVVARIWEPAHAALGMAGFVALPIFAAGLWGLVNLEERRSTRAAVRSPCSAAAMAPGTCSTRPKAATAS